MWSEETNKRNQKSFHVATWTVRSQWVIQTQPQQKEPSHTPSHKGSQRGTIIQSNLTTGRNSGLYLEGQCGCCDIGQIRSNIDV
mmetsp:Transcript_3320/g.4531  ORF Transcript_3320/g.4531 Transcript_3320/m.4531 type:complete len:84 (+) Transcript_3320:340-591(+)